MKADGMGKKKFDDIKLLKETVKDKTLLDVKNVSYGNDRDDLSEIIQYFDISTIFQIKL